MYVYKMIMLEQNEISEKCQELLRKKCVMNDTDYNTTEIVAEDLINALGNMTPEEKGIVVSGLGKEVCTMLCNFELDFVMVI